MISAVIITFNEERIIGRCIKALEGVADEILVVDSESSDNTVEICKKMGARVISHPFKGYRTQKNFACKSAKHQWILSLDADEVLSKELRSSLLEWRNNYTLDENLSSLTDKIVGYSFNRITDYCGTWIRHGGWYPDTKMRFYNRDFGLWSGRNVHEFVEIKAGFSTSKLSGDLLHYSITEPSELLRKLFTYSEMGARFMHEEGRHTTHMEAILRSMFRYIRQTFFQLGLLDGRIGLILSAQNARSTYWKYRRLLAMNKSQFKKILIIASTCPEEANIVSNAIKWFDKEARITIVSQADVDIGTNTFNAIVILDESFEFTNFSKKVNAKPQAKLQSVKVIKVKPSSKTPLALRGLRLIHKLNYPAAYRFPEKKDWDLLL
ncbi:MAG: hypothetical protein COA49_08935 [Bacteroidetes bacterium]|nr:MAG: hypothetical protein COA49_08935 [Bacteroidota bacterium]